MPPSSEFRGRIISLLWNELERSIVDLIAFVPRRNPVYEKSRRWILQSLVELILAIDPITNLYRRFSPAAPPPNIDRRHKLIPSRTSARTATAPTTLSADGGAKGRGESLRPALNVLFAFGFDHHARERLRT